jgi:hypothetical protein
MPYQERNNKIWKCNSGVTILQYELNPKWYETKLTIQTISSIINFAYAWGLTPARKTQ